MAKMLTFGLAALVTYMTSWVLYFAATLAYGIGLRPLIYGGILELATGILTVIVIRRERQGAPWLVLLMGVAVGRSLRGISEVSVLESVGGLSQTNAAGLVCVRIVLVMIGATVAIAYHRWRLQRRVA